MRSKESIIKASVLTCISVLLAISLVFVIIGWCGGHFNSVESFQDYVASYGLWGPIVLTLIQFFKVICPIIPEFLGCSVGAALFGWLGGFLVNYIGISAGSIAAYYLARKYGISLVEKMINMKKFEKHIKRVKKSKSYAVLLFFMFLLPLTPDDFFCYFSGLMKMPAKKYNIIVILAKPWCILLYSILFAYLL